MRYMEEEIPGFEDYRSFPSHGNIGTIKTNGINGNFQKMWADHI